MSESKVWLSPAKINLFLNITGQRDDGMHELQTAFQFVDLCDELSFVLRNDNLITRASNLPNVSIDDDLSVQAARLLQSYTNGTQGVDIHLKKVLPIGGGLGGASSNAATTLRVLNKLWGINASQDELTKLAITLGADVPIFIYGQAAWAEGIGEQFTPIQPDEFFYLIADTGEHISTAEMFADSQLTRNSPTLTICPPEPGAFGNVFEPIVRARYPNIDRVFNYLKRYSSPFLSGSGGCVVAAFDSRNTALEVQSECPEGITTYLVQGRNESPLNFQLKEAVE